MPRENICHSSSIVDYFEPYYFSGIKLTYQASGKLSVQLHVLNGYNTFIETNRNKLIGTSAVYAFSPRSVLTFNAFYCDESPDSQSYAQRLLYNDAYYVYRGDQWEFCAEANWGIQGNSRLLDSTRVAMMYSLLVAAKYKTKRFGWYGRGELFDDRHQFIAQPVENSQQQWASIYLIGGTAGMEFKPVKNAFVRLEGRYLHALNQEDIFYRRGAYQPYRLEGLLSMGGWF
jgi:hypothetical protein